MRHGRLISRGRSNELKSLIFLPAVSLLVIAQAASAADWQSFSPPGHEFSIEMPTPVTVKPLGEPSQHFTLYSSRDEHASYNVITSYLGKEKVSAADFFRGGFAGMKQHSSISNIEPVSGNGWTGQSFLMSDKDNKPAYRGLLAFNEIANIGFNLQTSDASSSSGGKRFLDSLKVFPDKAVALYALSGGDSAHGAGESLSQQIAPLWWLVLIGIGVFLIIRFRKAAAAKQSTPKT